MRTLLRGGRPAWLALAVLGLFLLESPHAEGAEKTNAAPALFQGHEWPVSALAITADGTVLASGGQDNTVRLWDLPSCRERATLRDYPGQVADMAFSPDGTTLATATDNDTVKLSNVSLGVHRHTISIGYRIDCLAFTPDSETIVLGGEGPIKLYDVAHGREQASLDPGTSKQDGKTLKTYSLAITRDGKTLYSGHIDGVVRAWDLPSGRLKSMMQADKLLATKIALSPDDKLLICLHNFALTVFDLTTGKPRYQIKSMSAKAVSLAFAPDGRTFASGTYDSNIRLWDTATGRPLGGFNAHGRLTVYALVFTPDGKMLLSGSGIVWKRGEIKRWNISAYTAPRAAK